MRPFGYVALADEIEEEPEEMPKPSVWIDIYVPRRRKRKEKQLAGQLSLFDLLREECG